MIIQSANIQSFNEFYLTLQSILTSFVNILSKKHTITSITTY